MMQAIEGIYRSGRVELRETPPRIQTARVIVTFLEDDSDAPDSPRSVVNLGEILDEDLAGARREIAAAFNQAITESARELEN